MTLTATSLKEKVDHLGMVVLEDLHEDCKHDLQVNILLESCERLYRHNILGHFPCTCSCPHKYKQDLSKELLTSSQTLGSPPRPPPTHFLNGTFQAVLTTPPKEQVLILILNKYFLCPLRSNLNHSSLLQISCHPIPGKQ